MPTPTLVIMAVVAGLTLNSSATNLTQAKKGASSGTEILETIITKRKGCLRPKGQLRVRGISDFEGDFLHDLFLRLGLSVRVLLCSG